MKDDASLLPLILRYRPRNFGEVCGHDGVVSALDRRLSPGDDQIEMQRFVQVLEMLCDLYGKNPNGECSVPFDVCLHIGG